MQITSKAQVVFGFQASEEQIEQLQNLEEELPNMYSYSENNDGKYIIGFMVAEQRTDYSYSDSSQITLLSPEKTKEIFDLLQIHFQEESSYFLIASCY